MVNISSTSDTDESVSALMAEANAYPDETDTPDEQESSEATQEEAETNTSESETPGSEEEEAETEEEGKEDKPAKKGGVQKRIDKITKEKGELASRLAEAERKLAERPAAQATPPAGEPSEPKADQFETYEAYVKALVQHERAQEVRKEQKAQADRNAQAAQQETAKRWNESVSAAKAKYTDFDTKLSEQAETPVSPAMRDAILDSDRGGEIAYFLANNPTEAARIAGLSPVATARAIGKIEAGLETPKTKAAVKTSSAPAPLKPVGSAATIPLTTKKPDQMSYREYDQYRAEQERKRNKR